jgi:hypothetical protein
LQWERLNIRSVEGANRGRYVPRLSRGQAPKWVSSGARPAARVTSKGQAKAGVVPARSRVQPQPTGLQGMGKNLDRLHGRWSRLAGALLLGWATLTSAALLSLWSGRPNAAETLLLIMIVLALVLLDLRRNLRLALRRDQEVQPRTQMETATISKEREIKRSFRSHISARRRLPSSSLGRRT